jgi:hypothetical protein
MKNTTTYEKLTGAQVRMLDQMGKLPESIGEAVGGLNNYNYYDYTVRLEDGYYTVISYTPQYFRRHRAA